MKSRLTLVLAGVMLIGAIIAGYQGLKLSMSTSSETTSQPEAAPEPATPLTSQISQRIDQEQRSPVVVLANELTPQVPITKSDVRLEQLLVVPPDSFSALDQVIGKTVSQTLPAGLMLSASHFDLGGPLARMIGPDERALAIAIDEVVAGGGFIRPGDYVDVLLYLRENQQNSQQTAQVVVPGLRVLSFGSVLGLSAQGEPLVYESEQEGGSRRGAAGNAVLAVPKSIITQFMLAAEAGKLRLAVRSAEEPLLIDYYASAKARQQTAARLAQQNTVAATPKGPQPAQPRTALSSAPRIKARQQAQEELTTLQRQLVAFEQLAYDKNPQRRATQSRGSAPAAAPRRATITIHRGPSVSQQTP